jgi:hypothetical protein
MEENTISVALLSLEGIATWSENIREVAQNDR